MNHEQTSFFDTFGVDGLKAFTVQDEQLTRADNITLVNIKFNLNACKSLSKNELDNLRDTARDFFKFYSIFWK